MIFEQAYIIRERLLKRLALKVARGDITADAWLLRVTRINKWTTRQGA